MRKLDMMYLKTKQMITNFFYDEQGDVNIVSMVILIGVAVLAAVLFKKQLKELIEGLFKQIGTGEDGTSHGVMNDSMGGD